MDQNLKTMTDVMAKMKRKIREGFAVAEVCMIVSKPSTQYAAYQAQILAKPNVIVNAYNLVPISNLDVGAYVIIVFCDSDFRAAVRRVGTEEKSFLQDAYSDDLHSYDYGVILTRLLQQ